jgi:uncharacterized surface protein with fasciclin (FAS1) repeats
MAAKNYTSILDVAICTPELKEFVSKVGEASLASLMSTKHLKRASKEEGGDKSTEKAKAIPITVFAPKKGLSSLKGEKLVDALKNHVVKGSFDKPSVNMKCEKHSVKELKMKTKGNKLLIVDCSKHIIKTKGGKEVKIGEPIKTANGFLFIINEPLDFE